MIRNRNLFAILVSGIFVASAADTSAQTLFRSSTSQTKSISKSYSRNLGNSWLGLRGYAYGYMKSYVNNVSNKLYTGRTVTMSSAHARGYLRGTASILKSTRELGRFDARTDVYSRSTGVTTSGYYQLRLAGKVVAGKSFTKTTSFPRFKKYVSLFPKDISEPIPVGPFTLTLGGNAGVGVEASGFALMTNNPAVGVSARAYAYGQGRAKAQFGIWGFAVGARLDARLAEQTVSVNLWANKSGIRGSFTYVMQALTLRLKAYAYAAWGWKRYENEVLRKSWGRIYKTLIRL
jgi:hypothetical protein